jgi:superfamily II DNA/RNA helicase
LLAAEGLTEGERLLTLYGGMDDEDRDRIKAAFQTNPEQSDVRILLATDAASEGIDLQNYCHRLVHFEIPWNPNRMEQRNGRIDRHGQLFEPLIYHFVMKGYKKHSKEQAPVGELEGDLEFLARAVEKVDTIREDLGKVGMVIASQVEEAMLGKRKALETISIEGEAKALRKLLKFERDLKKQVEQHYEQLRETQQTLNLSAENIRSAVQVALEIAEQPPLQPDLRIILWRGRHFICRRAFVAVGCTAMMGSFIRIRGRFGLWCLIMTLPGDAMTWCWHI